METGASASRLRRLWTTGREYLTHWAIAGAILTLTGFSPDHWVAGLLGRLSIPDNLRHGWLAAFDIRVALVAVGVAIIAWDVLRRSRLQKQRALLDHKLEAPELALVPGRSSDDRIAAVASPHWAASSPQPGIAVVLHGELRAFAVLMGEDVAAARGAIARGRDVLRATIGEFGGRLAQAPADAILAVFDDPARCLACAIAARAALARANAALPPAEHVHYRFGIDVRESGAAGGPPPREAVERAAAIVLRAPTDAIRLTEAVRAKLPDDSGYGLSAVEAGLFALDERDAPAVRPGPPQLESLALPLPERPSIVLLPFSCAGTDPDGAALAEGLRLDIQTAAPLGWSAPNTRVSHVDSTVRREPWAGELDLAIREMFPFSTTVILVLTTRGRQHRPARELVIVLARFFAWRTSWPPRFQRATSSCGRRRT